MTTASLFQWSHKPTFSLWLSFYVLCSLCLIYTGNHIRNVSFLNSLSLLASDSIDYIIDCKCWSALNSQVFIMWYNLHSLCIFVSLQIYNFVLLHLMWILRSYTAAFSGIKSCLVYKNKNLFIFSTSSGGNMFHSNYLE